MHRTAILFFAATSMVGGGCFSARPSAPDSFAALVSRNSVQQPLRVFDNNSFIHRTKRKAEEAWQVVVSQCGDRKVYSPAYGRGFRDGFIDYVDAGGNGEPPYLPPFAYRDDRHHDAASQVAIQDWYSGYRHGASVAMTSGLREENLIPLPGPVTWPGGVAPKQHQVVGPEPVPSTKNALPPVSSTPLPRPKAVPPANTPNTPAGPPPSVLPSTPEPAPEPRFAPPGPGISPPPTPSGVSQAFPATIERVEWMYRKLPGLPGQAPYPTYASDQVEWIDAKPPGPPGVTSLSNHSTEVDGSQLLARQSRTTPEQTTPTQWVRQL